MDARQVVKHDPKVRRDGRCAVCKGPRPYTPNLAVPREQYLGDPFCSSACCRKWYGTQITTGSTNT